MSISSTSGSLQSHLSSFKEKLLSLSPICPRCQEFLDLCDFKQIVPLSHSESLKLSTSRVVENCFLCSQFLGLYLAEPAQQAEYIEALRLNPQLVFDGFQQWSFCYNINSHSIARIFPPYHHTEEEIRNRSDSISSELQMLGVYSQKDLAGFESFIPVASFTGSDESLNFSKQWLQNCNENHVSCSRTATTYPNFLPTRLIDIGIEKSVIAPRLCLRKDIPSNAVYFTLSHCWGKAVPKITLLQSNIEFMLREISFSHLSNTFQDALWLVQKLGGRYIWIDSLCIVQDSETDWLVESASMCDVYSNGYCNICATAAKDGSEGLFRDRKPLQVQQGWFQTASDEDDHCVFDAYSWAKEVENSVLTSRAWVCQERLLSRRNLHFGSKQLFWECRDHEASETFPKGVPEAVFKRSIVKSEVKVLLNSIDKCQADMSFKGAQIWEEIVQLFMRSNITFKTDRLVAIGGMANAASQTIGGKYLAGVWENHLLSGILWNAGYNPSKTSKFSLAPPETQEFIAPSWSWASFNAEIDFPPPRTHRSEGIEQFLQILETHVDLAIDNPFGKVCGGYIKLKGEIASATCYQPKISGSQLSSQDFEILFGRDGRELESLSSTLAYYDFEDMTEIDHKEVYLLPVCRLPSWYDTWEVRALILFPTNRARWEFRRCGVFIYSTDEAHEDLMSECTSFSRGEKYESSEFGRQDDGKFIIKIF
ncbi:hypothetical protein BCIN_05g06400 [Botrytis cinerea B05.10]|uniref:Heterokaryon incompatibility domain-containing protein n=2 Tax=Botryotinia fuckeliana TaxID=40559 RepID=A0A384JI94_BOTFB|nr:hypothetical protein BCIN_05g06400 [Botrytis cinerea B05.10]ATZ50273.1 hypothetical protein BCIN_05g06400 [Botrytis cinerea B05.10]CCD53436.1 hypothetical protein BofuT4_P134810.1 [Botrytis cinerea T4]